MLHPDEETAVAERFGVARAQVRRDHLISHLLAAISTHAADEVIFFGGTALSRTIAPHGRLSEDIDLIALGRRRDTADLFDLWLLAQAGAISTEAAHLFTRHGPTTTPPTRALFAHPPQEPHWRRDLSGQTRLTITAHHAATIVGDTWDTTR